MPFTTYAELQSSISNFLNRDDLTDVLPDFIALAEAMIERDLRHWRMQERAETTLSERYTTRPGDWLETIRLTIDETGYGDLRAVSMNEMAVMRARANDVAGVPQYYCYSQDEIEVFPTPDASYTAELVYYKTIDSLSDSNTSNWLLALAPDVYLYGALIHSAPYLHDDVRAQTWASMYQAAVQRLNDESKTSQYSNQTLSMGMPR